MSDAYIQELVGLVVSQGFRAQVKPGSWAATHAADRLVRAVALPAHDEAAVSRAGGAPVPRFRRSAGCVPCTGCDEGRCRQPA